MERRNLSTFLLLSLLSCSFINASSKASKKADENSIISSKNSLIRDYSYPSSDKTVSFLMKQLEAIDRVNAPINFDAETTFYQLNYTEESFILVENILRKASRSPQLLTAQQIKNLRQRQIRLHKEISQAGALSFSKITIYKTAK